MAEKHRLQTSDFAAIYNRHFTRIYRVCFLYMKNRSDAEDAVSTVFLKLCERKKPFASAEHELGWLIVCAQNVCKNELRKKHRSHLPIDAAYDLAADSATDETLPVLFSLPEKYKAALYLYYYEGYGVKEIGHLLKEPEGTISSRLSRARKKLRAILEGGNHGRQIQQRL